MRAVWILASAVLLLAQQVPRTTIEGVVIRGAADAVSGATVRVYPYPYRASEPPSAEAISDDEGRFTFRNLPLRDYAVFVTAAGHLPQVYGAPPGSSEPGSAVNPANLDPSERLVVQLIGDGVISGRVTSLAGEPITGIEVTAFFRAFDVNGWPLLQRQGFPARTDDRGEYRLIGMSPGRYYLLAQPSPLAQLQNLLARSDPAEAIDGTRAPLSLPPTARVIPTFYPGVEASQRATAVEVTVASESREIDFVLPRQGTYTVRGKVIDPVTGTPPENLMIRTPRVNMELQAALSRSASYDADGTFEMTEALPGPHLISAQVPGLQFPPRGAALVNVANADVEGVVIRLTREFTVRGIISTEGIPPGALPNFATLVPHLVPINAITNMRTGTVEVNADGTFAISDMFAGQYQFTLSLLPPHVYIKHARLGSIDLLTDRPILVDPPGEVLDVLLAAGRDLNGAVRDATGKPVAGTTVVAVPEEGISRRHLYRTGNSDASGRFSLSGLAPGNYKVYAWMKLEPYRYFDEAFVQQFQNQGISIAVAGTNVSGVQVTAIGR
jgi:hypothetical protein